MYVTIIGNVSTIERGSAIRFQLALAPTSALHIYQLENRFMRIVPLRISDRHTYSIIRRVSDDAGSFVRVLQRNIPSKSDPLSRDVLSIDSLWGITRHCNIYVERLAKFVLDKFRHCCRGVMPSSRVPRKSPAVRRYVYYRNAFADRVAIQRMALPRSCPSRRFMIMDTVFTIHRIRNIVRSDAHFKSAVNNL